MQGTMRAKRVYLDVLEKGKVDIGAFGEEPETEEGLGKDQIEAEYEKYLKQSK